MKQRTRAFRNLVSRAIEAHDPKRPETATIHRVDGNYADIRIANSRTVIRHCKIIGDPTNLGGGQTVSIDWRIRGDGSGIYPVVLSSAAASTNETIYYGDTLIPDGITIIQTEDGLAIAPSSIGLEHLGFIPSIDGHNHLELAGGWQIGSTGSLYNSAIYIGPEGRIVVGALDDTIVMDSTDASYRLWAGDYDSASAPFRVGKDGAIYATAGEIASWTLGTNQFSADSGNAIINAATPYISLGGATAYGNDGFWVGKDGSTYKLWLGDAQNNLSWDGENLRVTGTVFAIENVASVVGGWLVVAHGEGKFPTSVGATDSLIDFGQAMTTGDVVLVKARDAGGTIKTEYILVGTLDSGTTYNVTRDLKGAHSPDPAWPPETIYVILGQNGDGWISLDAISSPRISIWEEGATHADGVEIVRIGDLTGWQTAGLTDIGWAVGNYGDDEYAYYTPTDGLNIQGTIYAGGGNVVIDSSGIAISGSMTQEFLEWYDGTTKIVGFTAYPGALDIHSEGISGTPGTELSLTAQRYSSSGRSFLSLGQGNGNAQIGFDYSYDANAYFEIVASGLSDIGVVRVDKDGDMAVAGGLAIGSSFSSFPAANTIEIGSDVNLYRSAANVLKTDDSLVVASNAQLDGYKDQAEISAPSTPASGYSRTWKDTYGIPWFKNDAGDSAPMMQSVINIPINSIYNPNNLWTTVNGRRAISLPESGGSYSFEASIAIPPGWTYQGSGGIEMVFWGAQTSAGTGNVFIWHTWWLWNEGSTPSGNFGASSNTIALPNVVGRVIQFHRPITNDTLADGDAMSWNFYRYYTHANDSATCDFAIMAMALAPAGFYS